MSILSNASSITVDRGYGYYLEKYVLSYNQIDEYKYESEVRGSEKEPYHVIIDIKHPKKSSCTCPFANGNRICKHMVATYFTIFPEEADDYQSWIESQYYDEKFEHDYLDEYDDEDEYDFNDYSFDIPFCFDELLGRYINQLSQQELREQLKSELEKDKERTFYLYLKKDYENYLKNNQSEITCLDSMNKRIHQLLRYIDYNYYNHSDILINQKEKDMMIEKYNQNQEFTQLVNRLLLNPQLSIFDQYSWIARFYKTRLSKKRKEEYINELNEFFQFLKHYSISNQIPKVNVLKSIYYLSDYSIDDIVSSMIDNAKYEGYIIFIIRHTKDQKTLYNTFKKRIENHQYKNKKDISNIFLQFYLHSDNNMNLFYEYLYYDTLLNKKRESMIRLKSSPDYMTYVNRLLKETNNCDILEIIYSTLNQVDELYQLLIKENQEYLFIRNIDILKEKYSKELYQMFHQKIYEILDKGMGREIYFKAAHYIPYIARLDDSYELLNQFIDELKTSKHAKKPALFDEINIAMRNHSLK